MTRVMVGIRNRGRNWVHRTGVIGRVSEPGSRLGFEIKLGIGKGDQGRITGMGSRSRTQGLRSGFWVRIGCFGIGVAVGFRD